MPRPRPPENIKPFMVRLTMRQWAKVQELGGAPFLRKLIAEHNPARDLEIVRCVLEAAAKAWNEYEDEDTRAATFIRALEFRHHE